MLHHTKNKGDLAVVKAIADLVCKGYSVFTPVASEHLRFDLVAYKDYQCYRIQVKYNSSGVLSGKTSWVDKTENHYKYYEPNDFDYYALYLPHLDKLVYPSISFAGCTITTEVPLSTKPFYWWEDFTEFTQSASKRTYREFGVDLRNRKVNSNIKKQREVEIPPKEELTEMVRTTPLNQLAKTLGVPRQVIEKWCKSYKIEMPTKEHWDRVAYVMSQFGLKLEDYT